jgi:hypothetical protein
MWKYFSIFSIFSLLLPILWLIFKPIDISIILFWSINFLIFLSITIFIHYKDNKLKKKPILYLVIDIARLLIVLIFFVLYLTVFNMRSLLTSPHIIMFVLMYLYFLFAYVFIVLKKLKS